MANYNCRSLIVAKGTYGANGAMVFNDAAELAVLQTIKVDIEESSLLWHGGGREYERTKIKKMSFEAEVPDIKIKALRKWFGYEPLGNNGVYIGDGGKAVTVGVGFITDDMEEKDRTQDNDPYEETDKWYVYLIFKTQLKQSTLVEGEDYTRDKDPELKSKTISGDGLKVNGHAGAILEFNSFETANEYLWKFFKPERVVGIDLGNDNEGNPVVQPIRGLIGEVLNLRDLNIQDPQGLNRQIVGFINSATGQMVDTYFFNGASRIAVPVLESLEGLIGSALSVVWGDPPQENPPQENPPQENPPQENQNPNNQNPENSG